MPSSDCTGIVCCRCLERAHDFVTRAEEGSLYQICRRCFHLAELDSLLQRLPSSDDVRRTAEEGLETLYLTVKSQVEDLAITQYAAKGSSSKGEGCGSSEEGSGRGKSKRRRRR